MKAIAKGFPELRDFSFDHPWADPRTTPFPRLDGQTIRSEERGDFRIISVVGDGNSIAGEIRKRIRACPRSFPRP